MVGCFGDEINVNENVGPVDALPAEGVEAIINKAVEKAFLLFCCFL